MSLTFIKENLAIDRVLEKYTKLTSIGAGKAKGLCPFHNEKNPSFFVNVETGLFYCHGCKTGGDVLTVLNLKEGIPYAGMADYVEEFYGLNIPDRKVEKNPEKEKQISFLKLFFERFSQNTDKAQEYLKARVKSFRNKSKIGAFYVSKKDLLSFIATLPEDSKKVARDLGVYWSNENSDYPAFGDRVIFPLFKYKTLVGLNGRTLSESYVDTKRKYLLTQSGEVFKKSDFVYGIQQAREVSKNNDINYVYVTEGVLDAITLLENNIPAVSILGSYISERQFKMLSQSFETLYLCLDGDSAGLEGATKSLHDEVFINGLQTSGFIVNLPKNEDVTDFLNKNSLTSFKNLPVTSFEDAIINTYIRSSQKSMVNSNYNVDALKISFLKNVLPKLLHYKTNSLAYSVVIRISERLGFDLSRLFLMIDNSVDTAQQEIVTKIENTDRKELVTLSPLEIRVLSLAYSHPKIIKDIRIKPWYSTLSLNLKDLLEIIDNYGDSNANLLELVQRKSTIDASKRELYLKTLMMVRKITDTTKIKEEFESINEIMGAKSEKSKALRLTKATQAFVKKNKLDAKKIIEDNLPDIQEPPKEKSYIIYWGLNEC